MSFSSYQARFGSNLWSCFWVLKINGLPMRVFASAAKPTLTQEFTDVKAHHSWLLSRFDTILDEVLSRWIENHGMLTMSPISQKVISRPRAHPAGRIFPAWYLLMELWKFRSSSYCICTWKKKGTAFRSFVPFVIIVRWAKFSPRGVPNIARGELKMPQEPLAINNPAASYYKRNK